MKLLGLFAIAILGAISTAQAATPALYCVSTQTYSDNNHWPVNQINIFTDTEGALKINLQYYTWGQQENEYANITTGNLVDLKGLTLDEATQTLNTADGKFSLALGKEITASASDKILSKKNVGMDFMNPAGMLLEFKKYRLATVKKYDFSNKKNKWTYNILIDAYKSGVTTYVCGDHKDIKRQVEN